MLENRRVRFQSIEGITRADLPLAAEIWLEDMHRQSWPTREALKLATHFKRYMARPDPKDMTLRAIERHCQLDRKVVLETLRQMQMFGAVEAFGIDGDQVRASLSLGVLQRLRTREASARFRELGVVMGVDLSTNGAPDDSSWLPAMPPEETDAPAAQPSATGGSHSLYRRSG